MGVEKNVKSDEGLTVYTAKGTLSGEDVKNAITDFYEHGPVTRNVIWDLTRAVLENFKTEDVRSIARIPRTSLELRQGGKTAIVAPTDLAFGLSRMYQSSSPPEDLPFELQVFREIETAQQWLAGNTSQEK